MTENRLPSEMLWPSIIVPVGQVLILSKIEPPTGTVLIETVKINRIKLKSDINYLVSQLSKRIGRQIII